MTKTNLASPCSQVLFAWRSCCTFQLPKNSGFLLLLRQTKHHLLSKSWEQELVKEDGWERGRETGEESCRKPPNFLSHKYIHYLMDERLEKAFSFLSYISKELISMINLNWDWEQFAKCSFSSLQFAPVSHSRLVCFLIASPCLAVVSASAPKLPPSAQLSEAAPVLHAPLSEAALAADTCTEKQHAETQVTAEELVCLLLPFPEQAQEKQTGKSRREQWHRVETACREELSRWLSES